MKASNTSVFARRLLTALAVALMALEASAVDLISNLIRCATNMTPYVVLKGVERTSGKFYGYKNASTGPGDNAFRDAKAWADEHNTPLVVVYDSGGGNSNTFTADLNDDEDYQGGRYLLQWMNGKAGPDNYNCMFTYFKGPTTAPKACKEAYEFCVKYGASSFPCVVCYWKWPDGTIKTSATSGLSSVGSFEGPVNTFITKNKPPPTPPYVPPKSNAAFAVKDGELKATVGTAQVYVPVIRTNGTDKAEKEYLVAGYSDGTAKTNDLSWAVGGAYIESSVNLAGKLSKVGDKVALYLLNTNKIAVATNSITCVAKPSNAMTFPYLPGEVNELAVGEWSVDAGFINASSNAVANLRTAEAGAIKAYDTATNALFCVEITNETATAAYIDATNALAEALAEYVAASNELDNAASGGPAYEEAEQRYINATNALYYADVTNEAATSAYIAATNALAEARAGFLDASNTMHSAIANLDEAESEFFIIVSGAAVSDEDLALFIAGKEYREWAQANKVRNIMLDATILAYDNKTGAAYRSINGISGADASACSDAMLAAAAVWRHDKVVGEAPELLLVRADGTAAGTLTLYRDDNGCDPAENVARLDELVENAADRAESANDAPSPSAATLAFDGEATGVLTVNDTIDCFRLSGDEWVGRKVVFAISGNGRESSYPNVTVLRYDAKSGAMEEIEGELSVFATNGVRDAEIVYAFSQADIAAGRIFVAACAYDIAAEDKFGGGTAFGYSVTARDATPNSGIITFDEQPETAVIQEATNQVYDVPLYRLFGSDGDLNVNVVVDEALTTATGRFEFTETSLVWTNGETGVKYARLVLKGSEYNDGLYDITLRIEEIDALAGVEKYFTTYTISYGKEPTDEGQLAVVSVSPAAREDGRIYVRHVGDGTLHADDVISVQVNRTGGKGPAAAYISWKNGKYAERATLSWGNYLTGTQTAFLEYGFPEPAKSGYADVTVAVTSSNSVPMVKEGATFKVRVLSHDAPPFADAEVTWSGVQYTTTETNLTALVLPAGMNVKSLAKLSGDVPAGLKVAIVDGRLEVTGTPTAGTVSSTAVYWVTLVRDDGSLLRSMPVTVSFENKALADVNPGFTKTRTWTGLPLMEETKLTGLLDLTVAKNGKTSARYRMVGGKTVAFSAPGLAGVDPDGTVRLKAEKNYCCGAKYVFDATLCADGSLDATIRLAGGCNEEILGVVNISAGAEPWSADNTASRFGGDYVAAFPLADLGNAHENTLCFGSPTVRLKFDSRSAWNRGVVTFAGTLPNGKAVSGTATLVPTTNNAASASLPLFASSSSDTFSAMLELDGAGVAGTQGVVPFWAHDEGGIESLSYENDYSVVGSLWSWAEWKWAGERVNVNKTSGVAAGTMRLKLDDSSERLSTVSWKGVAVPGLTPAIYGAYWYNKSLPAGDGKKRTVRVGNPVELK